MRSWILGGSRKRTEAVDVVSEEEGDGHTREAGSVDFKKRSLQRSVSDYPTPSSGGSSVISSSLAASSSSASPHPSSTTPTSPNKEEPPSPPERSRPHALSFLNRRTPPRPAPIAPDSFAVPSTPPSHPPMASAPSTTPFLSSFLSPRGVFGKKKPAAAASPTTTTASAETATSSKPDELDLLLAPDISNINADALPRKSISTSSIEGRTKLSDSSASNPIELSSSKDGNSESSESEVSSMPVSSTDPSASPQPSPSPSPSSSPPTSLPSPLSHASSSIPPPSPSSTPRSSESTSEPTQDSLSPASLPSSHVPSRSTSSSSITPPPPSSPSTSSVSTSTSAPTSTASKMTDLLNFSVSDLPMMSMDVAPIITAAVEDLASDSSISLCELTPDMIKNGLAMLIEMPEAKGVEELSLDGNKLREVPVALLDFTQLTALSLENNAIRTLPPTFFNLKALQRLHLGSNQLQTVPAAIGTFPSLRRLFLENNGLTSLPSELGSLTGLVWLSLDNNRLTSIPAEIRGCKSLEYLSIESNNLQELAPEIFEIQQLTTISVLDNPSLAILPLELSRRPDLTFRFNGVCTIPPSLLPRPNQTAGSDIRNTRHIFDYLQNIVSRHNLRLNCKAHWQPDSESPSCTKCNSSFTVTKRRHHCRVCGRVFDKKCCSAAMNLPALGSSRICADCFSGLAQDNPHLINRQHLAERPDELSLQIQALIGVRALSPSEWNAMAPDAQKHHLTHLLSQVSEVKAVQENTLGNLEEQQPLSERERRETIRAGSSSILARSTQQIEETKKKIKFLEAAQNRIQLQLQQIETLPTH